MAEQCIAKSKSEPLIRPRAQASVITGVSTISSEFSAAISPKPSAGLGASRTPCAKS